MVVLMMIVLDNHLIISPHVWMGIPYPDPIQPSPTLVPRTHPGNSLSGNLGLGRPREPYPDGIGSARRFLPSRTYPPDRVPEGAPDDVWTARRKRHPEHPQIGGFLTFLPSRLSPIPHFPEVCQTSGK